MTLTPFLILILAGYALFVGVLGWVSIWSNRARQPARSEKAAPPACRRDQRPDPATTMRTRSAKVAASILAITLAR